MHVSELIKEKIKDLRDHTRDIVAECLVTRERLSEFLEEDALEDALASNEGGCVEAGNYLQVLNRVVDKCNHAFHDFFR